MTQDDRLTGDQNQEPEWRWQITPWNCPLPPCPLATLTTSSVAGQQFHYNHHHQMDWVMFTVWPWSLFICTAKWKSFHKHLCLSTLQNTKYLLSICAKLEKQRGQYLLEVHVFIISNVGDFRRVRDGGRLGPAERGRGPAFHPPACKLSIFIWSFLIVSVTEQFIHLQVSVPIVSNEKCKNMFLAAGRHEVSSQLTYLLSAGAAGYFTSSILGKSLSEVCEPVV